MPISIQNIANDQWNQPDLNPLMHAKSGDWRLARDEYLEMGRRVLAEGRVNQALNLFLYVCALDLNGAQDSGNLPKSLQNKFPGFDPSIAFLAPDAVEDLHWTAVAVGIGMDDLRDCFIRIAAAKFFPVSAQKSWSVLDLALHGNIDLRDQLHGCQQIRARLDEQKDDANLRSAFHFLLSKLKSVLVIIFPASIGGGRGNVQAVR
jgi:hypothetical protein